MPSTPSLQSTPDDGQLIDNNFSNVMVVASGSDPAATITLTNNYWGTTTTSVIESQITDHHVNSNLPTVNFNPPLSAAASTKIVASSNGDLQRQRMPIGDAQRQPDERFRQAQRGDRDLHRDERHGDGREPRPPRRSPRVAPPAAILLPAGTLGGTEAHPGHL